MSQTKAQLIDPVDGSIVTADIADDAVNNVSKLANVMPLVSGSKSSPEFWVAEYNYKWRQTTSLK